MASASNRSVVTAQLFDLLVVSVFVILGRRTHDESSAVLDVLQTLAPFGIGLLAGWLLARIRMAPMALRTGVIVWAATVVIGMVSRRVVFGEGTATAFVVVATLFLAAGLIGWRLLAPKLLSISPRLPQSSGQV